MNDVTPDDLLVQRRLAEALDDLVPGPHAERRILRTLSAASASTARGRMRRLVRPAGSRLLALGAGLAMAGVLAASIAFRHSPTAGPSAHPSRSAAPTAAAAVPAPSGDPAPIPSADQRFVWLRYLALPPYGQQPEVHVLDWTGALRSTFRLPAWDTSGNGVSVVSVAPDGRVGVLSTGAVVDWAGRTVGHVGVAVPVNPTLGSVRWSDDDRHLCSAAETPISEVLTLLDRAGAPRTIAVLPDAGWDTSSPEVQVTGRQLSVLACSKSNDRAVVMRTDQTQQRVASNVTAVGTGSTSIWTVQLSTGHVISHLDVHTLGFGILASSDGTRLVYRPVTGTRTQTLPAPGSGPSGGSLPVPPAQPTTMQEPVLGNYKVVDLDDGRSIGEVPAGDDSLLGLSADGSVAVISVETQTVSSRNGIRLVDLRTGRTVLSRQGVEASALAVDPVSGEFMVETASVGHGTFTLGLDLVDTAGRSRDLPSTFGQVTTYAAINN